MRYIKKLLLMALVLGIGLFCHGAFALTYQCDQAQNWAWLDYPGMENGVNIEYCGSSSHVSVPMYVSNGEGVYPVIGVTWTPRLILRTTD